MDAMLSETALKQIEAGRKEMVARLRVLAAQLERPSRPDVYEVMVWMQAHVDQSLSESDRILGALDAEA
jgi:hypothetical protein